MNLFVWAKEVERAVLQVREHAEKRENWYRPGLTSTPPGEDAFFIVYSGTTKAVFSWTVMPRTGNPRHPPEGSILRHMSASVHGEGRFPRPEAIWTLAHYFGFTGVTPDEHGLCRHPSPSWVVEKDDAENCIILQQLVEGVTDGPLPSGAQ